MVVGAVAPSAPRRRYLSLRRGREEGGTSGGLGNAAGRAVGGDAGRFGGGRHGGGYLRRGGDLGGGGFRGEFEGSGGGGDLGGEKKPGATMESTISVARLRSDAAGAVLDYKTILVTRLRDALRGSTCFEHLTCVLRTSTRLLILNEGPRSVSAVA